MASVMQAPLRSWDVQELTFMRKNRNVQYTDVERFFKEYEQGAQIAVFIRRTAYSGPTNSERTAQHGANIDLFTVQKHRRPLTEAEAKYLRRLAKPSCGRPNCGHVWDNSGMTHVH